jgi:tetratricopeptide (TPR) repeat protein
MDHVSSTLKELRPFMLGFNQIFHQPKNIFHPKENLYLSLQILGLNSEQHQSGTLTFKFFKGDELFYEISKGLREYQEGVNFVESFPLQEFPPGYYRIKVAFLDGELEILTKQEEFAITSASVMPRPWIHYKQMSPPDDPVYDFILGKQHLNRGEIEKAVIKLDEAYRKKPDSLNYAFGLAQAYFALKSYVHTKEILLPFSGSEKTPYQVYLILGKSQQALGEYNEAISTYQKAISHYGINIILLNSLGDCYYGLGIGDEALTAWEKSLEIKPDQPEIQRKIKEIKK